MKMFEQRLPQKVTNELPNHLSFYFLSDKNIVLSLHERVASPLRHSQCDQIGQNFVIWAKTNFLGRFFQEFINYWSFLGQSFIYFRQKKMFKLIYYWANFRSNHLVTLLRVASRPLAVVTSFETLEDENVKCLAINFMTNCWHDKVCD